MPKLSRLEKEEFSKKDNEWQWTYSIQFELIFNEQLINYITITGHPWKKPGREKITKELILSIFKEKLNKKEAEPGPKNPTGKETILFWKEFHLKMKSIS